MTDFELGIEREIGMRGKLREYVEMCWPIVEPESEFVPSWHIDMVCEHLEAVHNGEIDKLVINQPPGTSKSILVCVFFPNWCWIRDPGLRWIFGSFDKELTMRDAKRAHEIITSPWHK